MSERVPRQQTRAFGEDVSFGLLTALAFVVLVQAVAVLVFWSWSR
jgi:hypothetical protein